jgi:serine/threonine protein kinase
MAPTPSSHARARPRLLLEDVSDTPASNEVAATQTQPYSHLSSLGRYRLIAQLGSGGMGEVFLAVTEGSEHFRKLAVVKRLRPSLASDPYSRRMFFREASLAARLNHPNIVQTYEVGARRGVFFMAMEYVEGQTMKDLLAAAHACGVHPDPRVWVYAAAEALAGLHYAHELRDFDGKSLQVIHRDVSPHNIVVTYEGHVRLIDFGVAKVTASAKGADTGVLAGKRGYMAPEYLDGDPIDRRIDIFAMGVVLWEALAAKRIPGPRQLTRDGQQAYPRVSRYRRVPRCLDDVVARALAIDPNRRWQSAADMRDALEDCLSQMGGPMRKAHVGEVIRAYFEEDRSGLMEAIRIRTREVGVTVPVRVAGRPELHAVPRDWAEEAPTPKEELPPVSVGKNGLHVPPPPDTDRGPATDREEQPPDTLPSPELTALIQRAHRITRLATTLVCTAVILAIVSLAALAVGVHDIGAWLKLR